MIPFRPEILLLQAADAVGEALDVPGAELIDKAGEAAGAAEEVADAAGGSGSYIKLLFALATIALPFVVGGMLASALKLKDMGMRLGVCLFAATVAAAPFLWHLSQGTPWSEVMRQGIDLAGGTNLVYQAVPTEDKPLTSAVMQQMVGAVMRRSNPSGTEEITVRQVGADRIEVIIPGRETTFVDDIKRKLVRLGSLEFAIMANTTDHPELVQQDRNGNLIGPAMQMPQTQKDYRDPNTGEVIASWREVGERSPGVQKDVEAFGGVATRDVDRIWIDNGKKIKGTAREYLLMMDPPERRITGEYLTKAEPTFTQSGLVVGFRFNSRGAFMFQRLTKKNLPRRDGTKRRLAILLDGKIHSAPNINSVISDNGVIEGDFTQTEVNELVGVLNAGALVVPLKPDPISEATVDPLLGRDVRDKGIFAIQVAALAVVVFMLFYYRFAGLVAVLCLALNLLLVLSTMVLISATFTLPGLAGLVLTIGMAVDANVLIFERIREELNRGSSMRMAIQNGFDRAFTTIVDANVTTLITAVILFMIGTDQVKGFAVTLFIGIVMSMFAALYFGRLIFDLAERKRWISKLSMSSIVGKTDWDFVGKRKLAAIVSVCLIVLGLGAFFSRGQDNYDIDFTGGTMVTFQFTEPQETSAVEDQLATNFDNFSLERLSLSGNTEGSEGKYFRLRTTLRDAQSGGESDGEIAEVPIRKMINDTFAASAGMELLTVTMENDPVVAIPVPEAGDATAIFDEFAGGNAAGIRFSDEVTEAKIRDLLTEAIGTPDAQNSFDIEGIAGSGIEATENEVRKFSEVTVKVDKSISADDLTAALGTMKASMAASPHFDEVNSFASSVAGEMKQSAIFAIVASLLAVVAYIWFRFQRITFGIAAVAALVHDVLIVLGMVALAGWMSGNPIGQLALLTDFRLNLPMIAAFLTIVGYSLNDTIVVFDRIREVRGKNPAMTEEIVNTSLNQTLSRTLLTSITTFLVVAILYLIGGEGIHGFAFCLVLGVIVGTYSSIYVASPVLLWLMNRPTGGSPASANTKPEKAAA